MESIREGVVVKTDKGDYLVAVIDLEIGSEFYRYQLISVDDFIPVGFFNNEKHIENTYNIKDVVLGTIEESIYSI